MKCTLSMPQVLASFVMLQVIRFHCGSALRSEWQPHVASSLLFWVLSSVLGGA
jgi:hypothetical protein